MHTTALSADRHQQPVTPSAKADAGLFAFFRHHGVWAPGVRLFRRVDFKAKAAFISTAFAVPIALLSLQFYLHGQDLRDATQREIGGIEAVQHADALLAALRAERLAVLSGSRQQPELAAIDASLGKARADGAHLPVAAGLKAVEEAHTALR